MRCLCHPHQATHGHLIQTLPPPSTHSPRLQQVLRPHPSPVLTFVTLVGQFARRRKKRNHYPSLLKLPTSTALISPPAAQHHPSSAPQALMGWTILILLFKGLDLIICGRKTCGTFCVLSCSRYLTAKNCLSRSKTLTGSLQSTSNVASSNVIPRRSSKTFAL